MQRTCIFKVIPVSSFLRRVSSFCALSLKASLMITLAPTVVTSLTVYLVGMWFGSRNRQEYRISGSWKPKAKAYFVVIIFSRVVNCFSFLFVFSYSYFLSIGSINILSCSSTALVRIESRNDSLIVMIWLLLLFFCNICCCFCNICCCFFCNICCCFFATSGLAPICHISKVLE